MIEKPENIIKYEGADCLIRKFRYQKNTKDIIISPLGIKVANILGQVYAGLYNIFVHCSYNPDKWSQKQEINVSVYGRLSSYDLHDLTLLFLCCHAAGIELNIKGAKKDYLKLIFREGLSEKITNESVFAFYPENKISEICIDENFKFSDFLYYLCQLEADSTKYQNYSDVEMLQTQNDRIIAVTIKHQNLSHSEISRLLTMAHVSATRLELGGNNAYKNGLLINIHQRQRDGQLHEAHPTIAQAHTALASYYNIDYMQTKSLVRV